MSFRGAPRGRGGGFGGRGGGELGRIFIYSLLASSERKNCRGQKLTRQKRRPRRVPAAGHGPSGHGPRDGQVHPRVRGRDGGRVDQPQDPPLQRAHLPREQGGFCFLHPPHTYRPSLWLGRQNSSFHDNRHQSAKSTRSSAPSTRSTSPSSRPRAFRRPRSSTATSSTSPARSCSRSRSSCPSPSLRRAP